MEKGIVLSNGKIKMFIVLFVSLIIISALFGYNFNDDNSCDLDIDGLMSFYDDHVGKPSLNQTSKGDLRFLNEEMSLKSAVYAYDAWKPYSKIIVKSLIEGYCK